MGAGEAFPQVLQLSKGSHFQMILSDIPCAPYSMGPGSEMGCLGRGGGGNKCFLLAEFEMLVGLYLHREGLQVLHYFIDCGPLSCVSWLCVLEQVQRYVRSCSILTILKSPRFLGFELTQGYPCLCLAQPGDTARWHSQVAQPTCLTL